VCVCVCVCTSVGSLPPPASLSRSLSLHVCLTSLQYHQSVINNAREANKARPSVPLAIAIDTKGPEIRTGNMVKGMKEGMPSVCV
jgi:hypothetical protein